jgi:hypothetical protein
MDSLNSGRNLDVNRGVELILRRKKPEKKTYLLCFEKMVSLFQREITIYFKFSLNIGKPR